MDLTNFISKLYYYLTAYIPRKLPENKDEFDRLQHILTDYYGVKDREDIWLTLCGQISSTPASTIRRSYKGLANACNRLDVNKTAQEIKGLYIRALENKLKEAAEKLVKDEETKIKEPTEYSGDEGAVLSIGTLDIHRDMQVM